jgi:hypothetical protein
MSSFSKRKASDVQVSGCDLHLLLGIPLILEPILQRMKFFKIFIFKYFRQNQDQFDLPYLYWIPKLHKNPYKQRYMDVSSKCSTKPLSLLLTKQLTAIKESRQRYCSAAYSRNGVNQMWILKNSKKKSLENLKSHGFS